MTTEAKYAKLKVLLDGLGITYTTEFVPQSKSRNAGDKDLSINWRVTLQKGHVTFTTDYMQGIGHMPGYKHNRTLYEEARNKQASEKGVYMPEGATYITRKLTPPSLMDVLYSLILDADALDYQTFELWADNFGYDADSRKAERIYQECLRIALQLRALIGDAKIQEVREMYVEEGY